MKSNNQDAELLLAYLGGELQADERQQIEQRLRDEVGLRELLLNLSIEEAVLTDWAKSERVSGMLDDEAFKDTVTPITTKRSSAQFGWWAAAAMLVISAVGFFSINRTPSSGPSTEVPSVASLVASIDAEWEGTAPLLNAPMPTGSYQLESGSIDLLFSDGARVSVSGPAHFDLRSARHIHLDSGNLVARIPDEALGFIVTSPQSEVVDLGTEFGLSVDGSGLTDVHVINGLVEVLPSEPTDHSGSAPGIMIAEGEARRFSNNPDINATSIPVSSRAGLIGNPRTGNLGLNMLRGSVRVVEQITKDDLFEVSKGPNWIDLAIEQRDVTLEEPLTVSIDAPGSYRSFVNPQATLPSGQRVNSYLLHFRPNSFHYVSGVIRFDQPIVAILCTGQHLRQTDTTFGVNSVYYPPKANDFQGLEPNGTIPDGKQNFSGVYEPDEIILSQDRTTVSIRTFAGIDRGYDQIRILTLAPDKEQ